MPWKSENPAPERTPFPLCFHNRLAQGKKARYQNALSRAPVNDPAPDDEATNMDVTAFSHQTIITRIAAISSGEETDSSTSDAPDTHTHLPDPLVDEIPAVAAEDGDYSALISVIESGFPERQNRAPAAVGIYWGIRHQLSVDHGIVVFGNRIVIPHAARRSVLKKLHAAHQGIVWTNRRARQTVYWPSTTNEITTLLATFYTCQERLPSHQQEPMMTDPLPSHVFEEVSVDLFQSGRLHVLVYTDRLSGWPVVHRWKWDPTAREVLHAVIENFVELGVPMRFRSDNGPQFDAGDFRAAMERFVVAVSNSTPNYSQSNGHAKAVVKAVKELVEKISPSGDLDTEEFRQRLLEFRKKTHENGLLPAQLVFGHQLRFIVPAHHSVYATCWKSVVEARDRQAAPFPISTNVRV